METSNDKQLLARFIRIENQNLKNQYWKKNRADKITHTLFKLSEKVGCILEESLVPKDDLAVGKQVYHVHWLRIPETKSHYLGKLYLAHD